MALEQEGIVLSVKDDIVKIRASRHTNCDHCGMCPGDQAIVVQAFNSVNAKVGDSVLIKVGSKNILKAAFIAFVLPLLAIALGSFLGQYLFLKFTFGSSLMGVITGGIVFFCIALTVVYFFEKKAQSNIGMKAFIVKKI